MRPEPLLAALDRVVDGVARAHDAGIDAEKGELADVRVGHDLEREPGERRVVLRRSLLDFAVLIGALDGGNVDRRRHVVEHRVEHRLHALVLEGRAAQHREDFPVYGPQAQALLDVLDGEIALLEVLVHELFGRFRGGLHHLLAPLLRLFRHVGGDVLRLVLHALRAVVPVDRLHPDEIDDALELVLGTDRQLNGDRVGLQPGLDLLEHAHEVGAGAVHLVDEDETRNAVLVGLAPHRLGLRLRRRRPRTARCTRHRARAGCARPRS